jgi:hypothetical protein
MSPSQAATYQIADKEQKGNNLNGSFPFINVKCSTILLEQEVTADLKRAVEIITPISPI